MKRARGCRGFSLMELMISTILLSVVFLACASLYVTANRFFIAQKDRSSRTDSFFAMEHMARRLALGNEVTVNPSQKTVKMRWDYGLDYNAPLGTPADTALDYWVKYKIIGNSLRWKVDQALAGEVQGSDPEVQPGLVVDGSGSSFDLVNGAAPAGPPMLYITLRSRIGTNPDTYMTQHSGVILRFRSVD